MTAKRPILVTGSHRSGSTWVGRMLAEAPAVFYIHEPFSVSDPPGVGICNARFIYWFTYITRENEAAYYKDMKNTVELRYNWLAALKSCKSVVDLRNMITEYGLFASHHLQGSRPLFKDPIALFSAEWLAERFNMNIVVVIRHPAAFVSSIKKLNWPHPFSHFLQQPLLMETVLNPFEAEIREYAAREHGLVDQGILLWRLIHSAIIRYQQNHKEWIFLRHEDISREPVVGFRCLYDRLNLAFSERTIEKIDEYSGAANPGETSALVGSETTLKRDSRSNIWNWKTRLMPMEVDTIRERVEDISRAFYSDEDW